MVRLLYWIAVLGVCWPLLAGGCAPELLTLEPVDEGGATPLTSNPLASAGDGSSTPATGGTDGPPPPVRVDTALLAGEYVLYTLAGGLPGDRVAFARELSDLTNVTAALFDQDMNLLTRSVLGPTGTLSHTLRESNNTLTLGLAAASDFATTVRGSVTRTATELPLPNAQVAYLNFGPVTSARVHTADAIGFNAFDAATLGEAYAGHTAEMEALIVAGVRADYASYAVEIYSSTEGPPPTEPHSVVYLGGRGEGLLGLADSVDHYNRDVTENAIVYVETFGIYSRMGLTVDEMAMMIANTASHELGHLLGLYHQADPEAIMDTTATAWELAIDQQFGRGPLYEAVFPTGFEDSPALLGMGVGWRSGSVLSGSKQALFHRGGADATLYRYIRSELTQRCGTCAKLAPARY